MAREHPDAVAGTSNQYQNWEVVDPEKWVPDGYVCVRVDSRGAGRSPGYLDHNSMRENRDFYHCIEWAAAQPWCSGKVGLNGISYYASSQWRAAALQPPHLAAICVWEGWGDNYRDSTHHGGILCIFRKNWQDMQVKTVQHGVGERGPKKPHHRRARLRSRDAFRGGARAEPRGHVGRAARRIRSTGLITASASADWSKVTVPLLSAANWGGQGLHPRGNFEGFMRAASKQKWLEVHGGSHWAPFYTDYGVELQKRFFDYFLKGEQQRLGQAAAGAAAGAPPRREVRRAPRERMAARAHAVDAASISIRDDMRLSPKPVAADKIARRTSAMGDGVTFSTPPLEAETEITGPSALKLFVSSSTADADIFAVLRVFASGGPGSRVSGRARSAYADRPGLAARFAPQARSEALAALPPVSHARRDPAAHAGRGRRARHRDLADLHRGSARLPRRAHNPRQGLRIRRRGEQRCRT